MRVRHALTAAATTAAVAALGNNDKDTIYFYKPSGARAYTKKANDRDGYITHHG